MSPPSILTSFEGVGIVKVGTRVVHLGRLDLGEGRITKVHRDGYCDAEFDVGAFSWLPSSRFCSVDAFERERLRQEEKVRVALEQARAREVLVLREKASREALVRNVRAGHRLNEEEWVLLRGLSAREQLDIFTSARSVELMMDHLVSLLRRASKDIRLRDVLATF